MEASFDASLEWLETHHENILQKGNLALWWMIQQSAELTRHPQLIALFEDYEAAFLTNNPRNFWSPMFYPGRWAPFNDRDVAGYDDYQLHLVFAINCDGELGQRPDVQAQLDPDYCDGSPLRPACVTHQMMGFRFMQRSRCGDPAATQAAIEHLQERLVTQLTWDPRVVDVYMQRVMMLVETGARERIKPIWLQRLLAAQQPDGGWSGFEPLMDLGPSRHLGFYARGIKLGRAKSDFHMTAQGVLLLSLLLQEGNPVALARQSSDFTTR